MKNLIAEESMTIRFPKGTRARIDAVRGFERQSDWMRRMLLQWLAGAPQEAKPTHSKQDAGEASE